MLIGKPETGKSSTGNTLLGRKAFDIGLSSGASKTHFEVARRGGREILVVDTPGSLLDTPGIPLDTRQDNSQKKDKAFEVLKVIGITSPGIHSMLLVIDTEKPFTGENVKNFEALVSLFGENLKKYLMVVFIKGDQMKKNCSTLEQHVKDSPHVSRIIKDYCQSYMVIDNTKPYETNEDASLLLQKIDEIVVNNGGQFFTNKSYEAAEDFIKEDGRRLKALSEYQQKLAAELTRNLEILECPLPEVQLSGKVEEKERPIPKLYQEPTEIRKENFNREFKKKQEEQWKLVNKPGSAVDQGIPGNLHKEDGNERVHRHQEAQQPDDEIYNENHDVMKLILIRGEGERGGAREGEEGEGMDHQIDPVDRDDGFDLENKVLRNSMRRKFEDLQPNDQETQGIFRRMGNRMVEFFRSLVNFIFRRNGQPDN